VVSARDTHARTTHYFEASPCRDGVIFDRDTQGGKSLNVMCPQIEGPNLPYRRGAETALCITAKLALRCPNLVKSGVLSESRMSAFAGSGHAVPSRVCLMVEFFSTIARGNFTTRASWRRNHIGGVIPSRPTRQARPCTVPSGCLPPMMKTLAPTFRSLLSPGT
jgi:hypothetical protein